MMEVRPLFNLDSLSRQVGVPDFQINSSQSLALKGKHIFEDGSGPVPEGLESAKHLHPRMKALSASSEKARNLTGTS